MVAPESTIHFERRLADRILLALLLPESTALDDFGEVGEQLEGIGGICGTWDCMGTLVIKLAWTRIDLKRAVLVNLVMGTAYLQT